jgi:hypothetical protein
MGGAPLGRHEHFVASRRQIGHRDRWLGRARRLRLRVEHRLREPPVEFFSATLAA